MTEANSTSTRESTVVKARKRVVATTKRHPWATAPAWATVIGFVLTIACGSFMETDPNAIVRAVTEQNLASAGEVALADDLGQPYTLTVASPGKTGPLVVKIVPAIDGEKLKIERTAEDIARHADPKTVADREVPPSTMPLADDVVRSDYKIRIKGFGSMATSAVKFNACGPDGKDFCKAPVSLSGDQANALVDACFYSEYKAGGGPLVEAASQRLGDMLGVGMDLGVDKDNFERALNLVGPGFVCTASS